MIKELSKQGLISKSKLLILNYKKIGLTDNQVLIISLSWTLENNDKYVSSSALAERMTLDKNTIEDELEDLYAKNFISLKGKKNDYTNLYNKLFLLIETEGITTNEDKVINNIQHHIDFELSASEKDGLRLLMHDQISKENIYTILLENPSIKSYEQLSSLINQSIKAKNKVITKINWLEG